MILNRDILDIIEGAQPLPVPEFTEEEIQEAAQEELGNEILATISYQLRNNGNIGILCEWNSGSLSIATFVAQILYAINNGRMEQQTFQVLIEHLEQNPSDKEFVEKLFHSYNAIEEVVNNEPIIKPRAVLGLNRLVQRHDQ